jgi:streptogramin lyase
MFVHFHRKTSTNRWTRNSDARKPQLEILEDRNLLSRISEFPIPTAAAIPQWITNGPDGNLWFTELGANMIARITPAGSISEFAVPTANSSPDGIATGADGNIWFVERGSNKVGRITTAGIVTGEFNIPTPNSDAEVMTTGPDGNIWFTEQTGATGRGAIARATLDGNITEFAVPTSRQPEGIAAGPDGNVWYCNSYGNRIGRITPSGTITEYPVLTANAQPVGITTGPDGNLWFGEYGVNQIGRITPSGVVSEFPIGPRGTQAVEGITGGPDGNLWFAGYILNNQILRMSTAGVLAGRFDIPAANAQSVGITAGVDGNLWFTEQAGNQIGRLNRPVLAPIGDQSVDEGSVLTVPVSATDSDPDAVLSYSLDTAPPGATIDSTTGVFTFTPTDGPATYSVTVRVTDNGTPALSDTATFAINVDNVAPIVNAGPDTTTIFGTPFSSTGSFVDPGNDTWTGTVNYGDGSGDQPLALNSDKTFNLAHSYANTGSYFVTATVQDDDGGVGTSSLRVHVVPAMAINDVTVTEGDTGSVSATFTVTLSATSIETVTVGYSAANGTATAPADYSLKPGTLTFAPGQMTKTITVAVRGDLLSEDTEYYFVNLNNAVNAGIVRARGVGTILDNDPLPSVSISDVTLPEGNSGTTAFLFTVTLSAPAGRLVTVQAVPANGTAIAPSDFNSKPGTVVFNPGQTSRQFMVGVRGDRTVEPDEFFFVNLGSPINATIGRGQGVGTILNDDGSVARNLAGMTASHWPSKILASIAPNNPKFENRGELSVQMVDGNADHRGGSLLAPSTVSNSLHVVARTKSSVASAILEHGSVSAPGLDIRSVDQLFGGV